MGGNLVFSKEKFKRNKFIEKEILYKNKKIKRKKPNYNFISKKVLKDFYIHKNKSMPEIAKLLGFSVHKISYWMIKYSIPVRNQSDATYVKRNPSGDPFIISKPKTIDDALLFGLGLGLYWGEENKLNENSIQIRNIDPKLIKNFIKFLDIFYRIKKEKLIFTLQISDDVNLKDALVFWSNGLNIDKNKFQKIIIMKSQKKTMHKRKTKYGILTIYFHNKKLKKVIENELEKFGYNNI